MSSPDVILLFIAHELLFRNVLVLVVILKSLLNSFTNALITSVSHCYLSKKSSVGYRKLNQITLVITKKRTLYVCCIKNLQFIYPFTSDKIWLDLIHTILSFLFSLWDFSLSLLSIVRIETKSTVLPHLLNKHKVALFLLRLLLQFMSIVLIPCGSCIWQKSCFPFYLQKYN